MRRSVAISLALASPRLSPACGCLSYMEDADADATSASTYDFVIAGGSWTAGIALAARLTENPDFKVLVIEGNEAIPGANFFLEGTLNLDWNFTTINQPTLNGRSILYTRGKCIGGSSVINFLQFNRGSSSVYDLWAKLGNVGWDWKSVLPYFKKYISYGQFTQPVDQFCYTSFYASAKNRPNFHVLTNTMVQQILLRKSGSTTQAYGVRYKSASGVIGTALASKELSCPPEPSRRRSFSCCPGSAPKPCLTSLTSRRLQDHPSFYVNVEVTSSLPTIGQLLSNPVTFATTFAQYASSHTGPLASNNGDTIGFQRFTDAQLQAMNATELIALGANWPNVEYLLLPAYNNPGFPNPPNATGNYVTVLCALVSPTSLGSVTISSTNINDPPVIDVNYLATATDQQVAVQGLKNAIAIAQSNAFQPIALGRDKVTPPTSVSTDAQMLDYVRNVMTTIWHASGTAAMLPQAQGGVVDSQLRVYGVQGLRIVDASVQPRITNQHVQAVVYMIAEKAAAFIKAKWEDDD
ncbi:hypothetical protein BD779DRAFT_1522326 [Infundibulicybe gibba]|nr:hypothetical protein BD779DRAFT_1522326 [Infundibulicybe gibba]